MGEKREMERRTDLERRSSFARTHALKGRLVLSSFTRKGRFNGKYKGDVDRYERERWRVKDKSRLDMLQHTTRSGAVSSLVRKHEIMDRNGANEIEGSCVHDSRYGGDDWRVRHEQEKRKAHVLGRTDLMRQSDVSSSTRNRDLEDRFDGGEIRSKLEQPNGIKQDRAMVSVGGIGISSLLRNRGCYGQIVGNSNGGGDFVYNGVPNLIAFASSKLYPNDIGMVMRNGDAIMAQNQPRNTDKQQWRDKESTDSRRLDKQQQGTKEEQRIRVYQSNNQNTKVQRNVEDKRCTRIYIENFPFEWKREQIVQVFSSMLSAATMKSFAIGNHLTRNGRRFGIMTIDGDGLDVIKMINALWIGTFKLRENIAKYGGTTSKAMNNGMEGERRSGDEGVENNSEVNEKERERDLRKIYIENIPKGWEKENLKRLLSKWCKTEWVYIANRTARNGCRFAFLMLSEGQEVMDVVKRVNELWIGSYKLRANVARFEKMKVDGMKGKSTQNKENKESMLRRKGRHYKNEIKASTRDGRSYADVVLGRKVWKEKSLVRKDIENGGMKETAQSKEQMKNTKETETTREEKNDMMDKEEWRKEHDEINEEGEDMVREVEDIIEDGLSMEKGVNVERVQEIRERNEEQEPLVDEVWKQQIELVVEDCLGIWKENEKDGNGGRDSYNEEGCNLVQRNDGDVTKEIMQVEELNNKELLMCRGLDDNDDDRSGEEVKEKEEEARLEGIDEENDVGSHQQGDIGKEGEYKDEGMGKHDLLKVREGHIAKPSLTSQVMRVMNQRKKRVERWEVEKVKMNEEVESRRRGTMSNLNGKEGAMGGKEVCEEVNAEIEMTLELGEQLGIEYGGKREAMRDVMKDIILGEEDGALKIEVVGKGMGVEKSIHTSNG